MFGVLFGVIVGLMNLGIAFGPVIAAHVYDVTQSYKLSLVLMSVVLAISSLLVLICGEAQKRATRLAGRVGSQ